MNIDQCGAKKKRPAPTASTAGTCLSVVNIGNATVPKVPRHLYLVSCFQEGMLEFGDLMGSVSADFRPLQVWGEGKKRKKDTALTRRVNPNSHTPHLQVQLAFALHNRLVLDRRLRAVSW